MNKIYSKINFLNRPSKKTPLNAANLNKMDEAIDGLDSRVVETNDALLVERARIDNLAKLPEGSTTGDAELIDGRVDYNGNTHANIGTHIREVSSQLSGEIGKKANKEDISSPYNFKGALLFNELPIESNAINDTYYCTDLKCKYTWNGTKWYQSSLNEREYEEELSRISKDKVDIENAKVHKKLYGIKDNACILSINKNGESAPVMGFTEESEISSYSSRDEVGISNVLKSDITNLLTPTTFTSESVILSEMPSNVKIGMIIDAINMVDIDAGVQTNKYSGFVTDFADNVIYVSGWYKYGDTSKGQIPNTDTVVINPCTHLWNENNVINLLSDGYANIGIVAECNLYNHKYESDPEKYAHTSANGYDVLSNAGRSEFGFRARALNGFFVEGFRADKCNTGFINSKSKNNGFQSNNGEKSGFVSNQDKLYGFRAIQNQEGFVAENPQNVGFHSSNSQIGFCSTDDIVSAFKTSNGKFNISGDGLHTCFFEKIMTQGSKNSNIVPSNSTIFLLTADATYTVPNAEDYTNCHVRIVPMTDGVILNFENCRLSPPDGSESVTTYTCTKRKTLNLISLNGFWYAI